MEKLFYSIKEAASMLGVSDSTLRYWEKEFEQLQPKKTPSGIRQYRPQDIDELRSIQYLLKEKHLSIAQARLYLRENRRKIDSRTELLNRLNRLRARLTDLLEAMEG